MLGWEWVRLILREVGGGVLAFNRAAAEDRVAGLNCRQQLRKSFKGPLTRSGCFSAAGPSVAVLNIACPECISNVNEVMHNL